MFRPSLPTRRTLAATAMVVLGAMTVTSCSSSAHPAASPSQTMPAGLETYYAQHLDWSTCDEPDLQGLECARLTVPLDYDAPDGDTVELAVARAAAKHSQGSVVINPGGPGDSGVDFVPQVVQASSKIADALDVVGFDPRGVGRSTAVTCDGVAPIDADTSTDEARAAAVAQWATYGQGCADLTGPLLGHVDTISAARDMDVLRAALGESTLTYLGLSYGTRLGQTYAALFPQRVGRTVLDGAYPATLTPADLRDSATAQDQALRAYVAACQGSRDCPLPGSVDDGTAHLTALVTQVQASLVGSGTDQATADLVPLLVLSATGRAELWDGLTAALRAYADGDGGVAMLELATTLGFVGGDSAQVSGATAAVLCADAGRGLDPAAFALDEQIDPLVLSAWNGSWEAVACADWPTPAGRVLDSYAAAGAPPIVVIGNTVDPSTPYAWAQQMASSFSSGVLVTYDGVGHTALYSGSTCALGLVEAYLVDGTVPAEGTVCTT